MGDFLKIHFNTKHTKITKKNTLQDVL